ncbi:argonaute 2 isoform 2-T2 [Cochliomyia hominivorax]
MGKKNKQQKQKAEQQDGQHQQQKPKENAQQSAGKSKSQEQQASGKGQQNPQQKVQMQQQQTSQHGAGQGQQQQKPQQVAWGATQGGAQGQQQKSQLGAWGGAQSGAQGQQQQKTQQAGRPGQGQQQKSQQGGAEGQQQKSQRGAWGGAQSGAQGQHQQMTQQAGRPGQGQQQKSQQGGAEGQQQKSQLGAWGGAQSGAQGQQQQKTQQAGRPAQGQQQKSLQGGTQGQQQSQQVSWGVTQGGAQGQQQKSQLGAWGGAQSGAQGQQQQKTQQADRPAQGQQQKSQQGTRVGPQGGSQGQRQQNQGQQRGDNTRSLEQNIQRMSFSSDDKLLLPNKPVSCNGIARGIIGQPGIVEVNYLKLDLERMPNEAYHYDVAITPDRPKKFLRPVFEQCRLEMFPNVICAFDGMKNCYTLQRLESPIERKLEVPDSGNRMKEFTVQIKETESCVVDMSSLRTYQNERVSDKPMRALQVLEVFLASNNHERGIRVGRSFFRRPDDSADLGDGYEAWTGLYQAAILGEQPLLNVDISHKSFPCESTLIDYLKQQEINLNADMKTNNYAYKTVCAFLKGLNIVYTPPASFGATSKQYRVLGIGDPAIQKKFKNDDGNVLTVLEYYKSKGYQMKYPNLNCLLVGSSVREISLPMELCSIPKGQALNRKDGSKQVDKMIRYAATSTNKRKQKIIDLLRFFNHNDNPIICQFGIRVGSNFIQVPMRLLPAPSMEYLQGQTVTTFKGAWRMDGKKFLTCSKPLNADSHKWAIIYDDNCRGCRGFNHHALEGFKTNVIQTSKNLNMNLQPNAEIKTFTYKDLSAKLRELAQQKFDLVFVVINDRGTAYSKVKQIAELEVGILTQCIKDRTVLRTERDRTVFGNILLKVNGKLNGTNHKIAQDKRSPQLLQPINNVMYLGADVTHPSPDQKHIPSVVGVAASHDPYGACYNCQYRLQRSTVENIEDMESIVSKHLETYRKYQNKYPSLIIYYRDGVSDGQFPIVEREEIRAIKSACNKLGFKPKLTCIIVVKRHHTRFFPLSQPQHERDFNNVQAGTVVDQHITHPNEVQFFMVSHQSIQGTARPTRYNVIYDESKFDINLLQQLTYNLCHLFPRCNRAVSYPAPAYLAHLVAFRGRVYLEGTFKFMDLKREYEKRQIKADFMIRNPMYFI